MTPSTTYDKDREMERAGFVFPGMRSFVLIWIGQLVSFVGSGMTCFAQSVWVYTDMGGSITNLTALTVFAQLPGILVSPLAGVLVDRWDRRWVMIISDTVAALATLTLRLLIVSNSFELWHIYVIVVIISMANHFQWPAYCATISLLVPPKNLGSANGLAELGRSLGQVGAPFFAGVAVMIFKIQGVILFDLLSYLFALAMLLVVRIPKPPVVRASLAKKGSLLRGVILGWRCIAAQPGLLGLLVFFSVSNFMLGMVIPLLLPMVLLVTSATVLGSLMSVGGMGSLLGSLAMSIWGGGKRRIYGVLGAVAIQGLAIMVGGLWPSVPIFFITAFTFYFAIPIVNACGGTIWQTKVAPDVQGRVFAATGMVSIGARQFAYLLAGVLAQYVFEPLLAADGLLAASVGKILGTGPGRGIGLMFALLGVLSMLAAAGGYLYPRLRLVDEELPDHSPASPGSGEGDKVLVLT